MERVFYRHRLWALLLGFLWLGWAGCADPADRPELPSTALVRPYLGTWEYRYGDSPQRPDGTWDFADPGHADGEWQATTQLSNPPGRGSHQHLWLRTRIVAPKLPYDTMVLPSGVFQSVEAFVDGRLVTRFGQLEGPAAKRYAGKRPVYLPIGKPDPSVHPSKTVVLRVYSPTWLIGFLDVPLLGGHAELLAYMVREGLPFLIIGTLFIIFGIGVLLLYARDRREILYALYAMTSIAIGVFECSRSSMRAFLFESPSVWRFSEIASLCLVAVTVSAFMAQLLQDWSRWLMRLLSWFFLAYFVSGAVLAASGLFHIENIFHVQLYLLVGFFVTTAAVATIVAWRGSTDWRILAAGFLTSAALGVYAVLQQLNVVRPGPDTRYYTAAVFVLTLGIVLARRFRTFNKQLTDYSTVLQLSFSSAQDLTPGHQAQIALAELLRMLKAERGLLFLCSTDGSKLDLVAGRDNQGNVRHDPTSETGYDQRLVAAVRQKRRPFVRQFKRSAAKNGAPAQPSSAVAAPLLARGQLLGVIYLDADSARHAFDQQDVEILLGLASQVALTLIATRAGKLESEGADVRQRLAEQGALLEVAARLARGDLHSPIAVPKTSELAPLAEALDQLRLDVRGKVDELESSHAAVRQLNEELRFQLDQRLRRLLDLLPNSGLADPASRPAGAGDLVAGELLGDHYQIVSLIGKGGSGSVYEVKRTADGRSFAAKVFSIRANKTLLLSFAREAQILARINHPNVVAIIDVDLTTDAVLFLVMELVRGLPLAHGKQRSRELPYVLTVLQQIAEGLAVVHACGIIHQDVKPANVLVAPATSDGVRPEVKLVDFGVATLLGAGGNHATPASAATDIFGFGVIAYELLCGEPPAPAPLNVLPLLQTKRPTLPPALAELIARCLSPDPAERPSAQDLCIALGEKAL